MRAIPLFASPLLTIREVVCDAPRSGDGAWERTETPCVALPLRGCYGVDRGRQTIVGDPNTAIFFEADTPYRVAHPADGGDASFVLAFDSQIAADAFGNGANVDAARRPFRASSASLGPKLQLDARLLRASLTCARGDPIAVEERALGLLAYLAPARSDACNTRQRAAVERAKAFLGQHFRDKISLATVARACGVSPFGLARTFRAIAGTTLHRYLVGLRHAAALEAIASGESDLARVAVDAGFAHHSHFTKTFARAFGSTPSVIRRRLAR